MGFTDYYSKRKMPSGAFAPQWPDLLNVYELVRRLKPRTIMEIGSGCSTLMYAQGLYDNENNDGVAPGGRIITLDASEFWLDATMKYVPEHCRPYVEPSVVSSKLTEYEGQEVSVVEPYPITNIDFLYVDGGLFGDNKIGADAVMLEKLSDTPFTVLVDGRAPSRRFLKEHLKGNYRFQFDKTQQWSLFENDG